MTSASWRRNWGNFWSEPLNPQADTSRRAYLAAFAFALLRLWYVSRIQLSADSAAELIRASFRLRCAD